MNGKFSDVADAGLILWGFSASWAVITEFVHEGAAVAIAVGTVILLFARFLFWIPKIIIAWRALKNGTKWEDPPDLP